jgi:hypothetical protein
VPDLTLELIALLLNSSRPSGTVRDKISDFLTSFSCLTEDSELSTTCSSLLAESGFSLLKSPGTVLAPLSLPVRDSPTKPLALAPPPLEYNIASDGKQASLSLIK